jgi:phage terminase large subunit-like protein
MAESSSTPKSRKRSNAISVAKRAKKFEGTQFLPPQEVKPSSDFIAVDKKAMEDLAIGKFSPAEKNTEANFLQEQIRIQEQKNKLIYELPFLYGWKWYPWAREFFESRNKQNFLCAANQISKSSTQIRKAIHWATATDLWPQLWARKPSQFWYLYPTQDVVDAEFELKWEREFLPRGSMKDDPQYGWKVIKGDKGRIKGIRFNSGVVLFFKTYAQDTQHLQTGTVDAIFCDEELPEEHYDELVNRLNASDGYFHMVFTATMGQEIWRLTMESGENEDEKFPTAAKWTISLYEAKFYEDGSPSHWTDEKIAAVKAKCKSHKEVLKRVFGRFIMLTGLKYPHFDSTKHVVRPTQVPKEWQIYTGADPGSGGEEGHPAALCYVAVSPDFRKGKVFLGWRGDEIETTNGDVVKKHVELKKEHNFSPTNQYYDHANKDFEITARRMHETFIKAEKGQEFGTGLVNTLFKHDMLEIYEDPELAKLSGELSTLRENQNKRHAKDDFTDALRYAVSSIPWDLSWITEKLIEGEKKEERPLTPQEKKEKRTEERRTRGATKEDYQNSIDEEFAEWNSYYEG